MIERKQKCKMQEIKSVMGRIDPLTPHLII